MLIMDSFSARYQKWKYSLVVCWKGRIIRTQKEQTRATWRENCFFHHNYQWHNETLFVSSHENCAIYTQTHTDRHTVSMHRHRLKRSEMTQFCRAKILLNTLTHFLCDVYQLNEHPKQTNFKHCPIWFYKKWIYFSVATTR